MRKVGLYTLGCKVSLYETEAVGEAFERAGYAVCPFEEACDVYVINTCTVTAESDAKSRKYIRRAIRKNPDAVVIVIGCYSQRAPLEVAAIDGVSAVLGTQDKMKCVEIADRLLGNRSAEFKVQSAELAFPAREGGSHRLTDEASTAEIFVDSLDGAEFEPMCVERAPRTRAYVKIEDGCECKCSYCAISGARGPVRSKKPEQVITEVEGLYKKGTLEIVLTGIETGSYGADFDEKYDLADLICELDSRHSCERIRLGSMAPELLSAAFVDRIAGTKIMVPHFHISMQSGSDNVLRGMRRRYNRAMALKNIENIRARMPRVMLTADLMVGFPGESEEDFLDTLRFVREAGLLDAHVFAYSKRDGTPAATYEGQIPEQVKRERSARLIAECARVRNEILSAVVASGEPLSCILESEQGGVYTAHSDSYIEVRVKGKSGLSGTLVSVKPLSHENGVIQGEII
ncbi:MAG: tRNA (N(6)-L-threonylcarbamoyladenosine(37)-C(2))-methylthiotransferase MtaB [Clostridia bacterium]|nr:tRNA (N(6)-L-threonylcarbamoyladenosine(37)-C(2))-methylthiotransferase MtaB [Clostridia bacterium]